MSKPAPIDWSGLLAWSSKQHDGTKKASDFKPLSDEDKDFLEGALQQAYVYNQKHALTNMAL